MLPLGADTTLSPRSWATEARTSALAVQKHLTAAVARKGILHGASSVPLVPLKWKPCLATADGGSLCLTPSLEQQEGQQSVFKRGSEATIMTSIHFYC